MLKALKHIYLFIITLFLSLMVVDSGFISTTLTDYFAVETQKGNAAEKHIEFSHSHFSADNFVSKPVFDKSPVTFCFLKNTFSPSPVIKNTFLPSIWQPPKSTLS
ncbi:MAG: hypothetical protein J0L62_15505 [Bacteroidetes bacterium]|nr:hypothetical protein [Bacteroidota bacterium]